MCVQGSQKCPGLKNCCVHGTTQHDAVRRNPTQSKCPTLARRNSQPRRSNNGVGSSAARVQSIFFFCEAKQPCPRPSAAVRGGETRVSQGSGQLPRNSN